MRPQWFQLDSIPFPKMWTDDIQWFPYLLNGSKFYGYFVFEGMNKIVKQKLSKVDSLTEIDIPQRPDDNI